MLEADTLHLEQKALWSAQLSQTAFWLIVATQWPENSLISFKKHATHYEKADHCTFPLFEKQQIIIVASEMEKAGAGKGYYMC